MAAVGLVTATNLTTSSAASSSNANTTASITPAANKLVVAWVTSNHNTSGTKIPTSITGNSLTWVNIASQANILGGNNISAWTAEGASPTSGAVTINWDTNVNAGWSIVQYDFINTSGTNGSGAIGQIVTNVAVAGGTSMTTSMSSYLNSYNAAAGAIRVGNADTESGIGGFSITAQDHTVICIASGFGNSNLAAPGFSWTNSNSNVVSIVLEIKDISSPDFFKVF